MACIYVKMKDSCTSVKMKDSCALARLAVRLMWVCSGSGDVDLVVGVLWSIVAIGVLLVHLRLSLVVIT